MACFYFLSHVSHQMEQCALEDKVIVYMIWHMYHLCRLIDTSPMWLPKQTTLKFQEHTGCFLKAYQYLSQSALVSGKCAWDIRPKFHYLWHAAHDLNVINLNWKVTSCWEPEKWLGKIKALCKSTSSGKAASISGLQRYLAFLKIRFRNRRQFRKSEI